MDASGSVTASAGPPVTVQAKRAQGPEQPVAPDVAEGIDRLEGGGRPLPGSERAFFEPRFGRDLSAIRVHADARAASMASAVDALAFTSGRHIVLGAEAARRGLPAERGLLAHELVHSLQQGEGGAAQRRIQRFTAHQCRASGCTPPARCDIVQADFTRAEGYLQDAVTAMQATPPSAFTMQAIDWYFHRTGETASGDIQRRLALIRSHMLVLDVGGDFLCDSSNICSGRTLAYVRTGTPVETVDYKPVNLCNKHFGSSARSRAETLIHEVAHLIGMSISTDDVYEHSMRFRSLTEANALLNADSYALFASAIDRGSIGLSLALSAGGSAGAVFGGPAGRGWAASEYFEATFQHPVLHIYNPTLRISATFMGVPESGETEFSSESIVLGFLPGLRIEDPRPSGATFSLSLFGGPSLNFRSEGGETERKIGAQAGIGAGFRWRWLDAQVGATYIRDPTALEGAKNLLQVGGSIGFSLGVGSP